MEGRALLLSERRALTAVVALTLLSTMMEAGFLVIVARVGVALTNGDDAITIQGDTTISMGTVLVLAAMFVTIRLVASVGSAALSSRSMARASVRMRSEFADAYLATTWDVKHGLAPGRVQQLLSSYTQTAVNIVSATARGLTAVVSLVALVAAAMVIQPFITLTAVVLVVALGLAMVPLRHRVQTSAERAAATQLEFGTRVNEMESLALEIEVHGISAAVGEQITSSARAAADANGRSQFAHLSIGPAYQAIAYGGVLALLAVGVATGVDDIGTIGAVLLLLLRCLGYGQSLQVARAQYTQSNVYAIAVEDEVARYRNATRPNGSASSAVAEGIAAHDLRFSYGDDVPTLHDLSFSIASGSIVGIVGPSGSGKSTLTQLLLGLRESSGALELDGVAIDDADPDWWSTQVALVPQHSQLLTGTVAENVRFLRPDVSDADIEFACRKAAIHDEIIAMGGYSAGVGERGGALSGGQRQRLCIARALAGRPSLLVLDEPTSALDTASERRILDTLAELRGHATVVVVTHRLSVLDVCDQVLALDAGRIAYLGPTDDFRPATPDALGGTR